MFFLVVLAAPEVVAGKGRRRAHRVRQVPVAATEGQRLSRPRRHAGNGRIVYVTDRRAYLDRGAQDGLAVQQTVQFLHNGRPVAKCVVEIVGRHDAVCTTSRAHPGDVFKVPIARRTARAEPKHPLPPLVPADALAARADAIATARFGKVDFTGTRAAASATRIDFGAGFTVWSASSATAGKHAAEQLDFQIRHAPLGNSGMRLDASATAIRWQTWTGDLRFRPNTPTQLYLWEAEVSRREEDDLTVFAVGRLWPWHVPGVPMLDGAQVGRRNQDHTLEWGAYGGLMPNTVSLLPIFDNWAVGVYGGTATSGATGDLLRFTRAEARLGVRSSATVGLVSEAEALTGLSFASFNTEGGARLRYSKMVDPQPVFEMAHVDLRLRANAAVGGWLVLRYIGAPPEQQPLLTSELPSLRGGYHAALNLSWDLGLDLGLALLANAHLEPGTSLRENEAGLELRLPLFGAAGGAWLGATLGEGWMRTRGGYVQILGRHGPRLVVIARLTGDTSQFTTPREQANLTEVGGNLQAEVGLTARVRLRARGLVRVPLFEQGTDPTGAGTSYVTGMDILVAL